MSKIAKLIISFFFLLSSCHYNSTEDRYVNNYQGVSIKYEYYSNGEIKSELPFNKDTLLEGYAKIFFENGKLKYVIQYKNGKEDGIAKYFYSNGNLQMELCNKDGLAHGSLITYRNNGKILNQYSKFAGVTFGRQLDFDSSGKLETVRFYNKNGEMIFRGWLVNNSEFKYEGYPAYMLYNKHNFNLEEQIELHYFFITVPGSKYQLSYNLDKDGLVSIDKNKVDSSFYGYSYILSQTAIKKGHHKYQLFLTMTDSLTQKKIIDTTSFDFNVR